MTSDRLRPCLSPCPQVRALGSHLFQGLAPSSACQSNLQQCGVPRVTSIYQENKRRTTVERYNSPLFPRPPETFNLADFQGIRANTLISIIFPSCRHGRCLNDSFRCLGFVLALSDRPLTPLFSRTPFPPIFGRRIMKLGRIQFC